jgi:cell fate regulator YaaT (PSP1 superfamily)
MNLVKVECLFDLSKMVFYFTADGRLDFRELVRDLVARFRTRVEMRQIGVRHEAKLLGGLGSCGRPLCCATFLRDFDPVSVKMAKEQNLSLNPAKISGLCGRLMCCLTYEFPVYRELKRGMPKQGKRITLNEGLEGKVLRQNVLERQVTVALSDGREVTCSPEELAELTPEPQSQPQRQGPPPRQPQEKGRPRRKRKKKGGGR